MVSLKRRVRDWLCSLAFVTVIGSALTLAGAWIAISYPLLRSAIPFPEPQRLFALESLKKGQAGGLSWMALEDLRTSSVQHVAGYLRRTWGFQIEEHGHVEVVLSLQITGEFFDALGVRPEFGQPLTRDHEQPGNQNWVWLSRAAWSKLLGEAPFENRTIWINSAAYRVAGVMPSWFDFPQAGESPEIYIPLNRADFWRDRGAGGLGAIARLGPTGQPGQFQAELEARSNELAERFPVTSRELKFRAGDLTTALIGDRVKLLYWMWAAIGTLLLISIANASGIWLAQWLRQQRAAGIQLCLGASKRQVLFGQAAELLWLAAGCALFGIAGTVLLLAALRGSPFLGRELEQLELWNKASLDWFTCLLVGIGAILASLTGGMAPLLTLRVEELCASVLSNSRTATASHSNRLRFGLAVVQLTLTATLGYAGILIFRNVQGLLTADRGFRTEQILISGIGISETTYNTDPKMIEFHRRVIEQLERIPGVTGAAGGSSMPVSSGRTRFLLDDESAPRDQQRVAQFGIASPSLLRMLSIPILTGRDFDDTDRWGATRSAVVNQAFVEKYLAGRSPLGRKLRVSFYNGFAMKPYEEHVIVGVMGNTRNRDLTLEHEPQILITSNQVAMEGLTYFMRSGLGADQMKNAVAEAVWRVDPEIQRVGVRPLAAHVEKSLAGRRALVQLLGLFGVLSSIIVGFGLASSLAATFTERRGEMGIRSALGAAPARLVLEAVRWGMLAVAASWAISLAASVALSKVLVLNNTPLPWDWASWLAAAALLGLIGILAAYWPARQAARTDPAAMMRLG